MLGLALALSACQPAEPVLPGERFDLRNMDGARSSIAELSPEAAAGVQAGPVPVALKRIPNPPYGVSGEARPITLPAPRVNVDWAQAGGSVQHMISQPALGPVLTEAWTVSIGQGDRQRVRMATDPVVAGGRVLTMDAHSVVSAHGVDDGRVLWRRDLTPPREKAGQAAGGGFAVADGRVFVTTGYGQVQALDLTTGAGIWTQKLGAVPTGGPAVEGGIVYLTSRDGQGWALDADTGRILWQINGSDSGTVNVSGAAPAVSGNTALFPFGSGEVVATLKRGGVRLWSTTVSGQRQGRAYAGIGDIAGDPVIVGNTVYVSNAGGRLAALNLTTGERMWTAREGALGPVWPVGGSLFLISDDNHLLRMNAADGAVLWRATLPLFVEERVRRRAGIFAHYGPVLAGGRLIVVSSDGLMRQIDPASGRLIEASKLSAGAVANPVVAGRTLYVVTADGRLHAFR